MTSLKSIREELAALKSEILAKRTTPEGSAIPETPNPNNADGAKPESSIEHQIGELNKMVKTMLDDAETTVADHPVATVAGALALGIVVGRLTSR
jgi:ElaB/YqjD/DUF883 family membrane-anchored ribosome-binding protein